MEKELPKAYVAADHEENIYRLWEESGFFNPDKCVEAGICDKDAPAYSIVLPPPNVTGQLHIGHVVMLAVEDLLIRYHRMKGDKTLWVPGTDHAAIATNAVIERQLSEEGKNKHDLGREKFLKRVEKYIDESKDAIKRQLRKMGSSLDWSREAYTLDEKRSLAVRTIFKMMYDDGLIYRGYRIVNWCPRCESTLADDEVEYKEQKTPFYYFKYGPVVIGTVRPETKFGDKVVIVHPDDKRYKDLVGRELEIEWITGKIKAKVIADEIADMEMGTGAMTITPGHSFADFDLAQKHNLEVEQVIDEKGNLTAIAGGMAGMNARKARDKVVEILEKKGLVEKIDEDYVHNLSVCYRCGSPVEPLPSKQWFVDVNKDFRLKISKLKGFKAGNKATLKKLMQSVVRSGEIKIIPKRFEKTYFQWIDNLRDWCISRQIWFGHRIPVWYCKKSKVKSQKIDEEKCNQPIVGIEEVKACPHCGGEVEQDPDTLDTWFSSGLWTFSTLGWPEETKDLKTYHPTSCLETMFDILFFWVARMIMMSAYALGHVPFKDVYLHARVLDKHGKKMSKSRPETCIEPLEVCQKYGSDAVRLSLIVGVGAGSDVRLSDEKIAGYRNFVNKLWNISRFILMGTCELDANYDANALTLPDQWILLRLNQVIESTTRQIENYNFSQAAEDLYEFTWHELADWYLEITKATSNINNDIKINNQKILLYILEKLLALWHPFCPYVTEVINSRIMCESKRMMSELLMVRSWPKSEKETKDAKQILDKMKFVQDLVARIRNERAEKGIAPKELIEYEYKVKNDMEQEALGDEIIIGAIKKLARLKELKIKN